MASEAQACYKGLHARLQLGSNFFGMLEHASGTGSWRGVIAMVVFADSDFLRGSCTGLDSPAAAGLTSAAKSTSHCEFATRRCE
mmetsp:Transcript_54079/g.136619  ORF Transcript_54079/g.136619 Transcript_54079/m.136619 type:complete len:84 (-) Transcript_54079:26-277(-)